MSYRKLVLEKPSPDEGLFYKDKNFYFLPPTAFKYFARTIDSETRERVFLYEPLDDEAVFKNQNPIYLEFCSGNGEWICQKAKENPQINWIAIEKRIDRAKKIWSRMDHYGLKNLLVVCAEAVLFSKTKLPKNKIKKIFVNFPDPWPKQKHAKHRLFDEEFMGLCQGLLTDDGEMILATDDQIFCENAMIELLKSGFRPSLAAPYYVHDWPGYGDSFFRTIWLNQGRSIYYTRFEKGKML